MNNQVNNAGIGDNEQGSVFYEAAQLLTKENLDDKQLQRRLAFLHRCGVSFARDETLGECRLSLTVNSELSELNANRLADALSQTGLKPDLVVIEHENAWFDQATGSIVYNG
jgi:hypothetical protein